MTDQCRVPRVHHLFNVYMIQCRCYYDLESWRNGITLWKLQTTTLVKHLMRCNPDVWMPTSVPPVTESCGSLDSLGPGSLGTSSAFTHWSSYEQQLALILTLVPPGILSLSKGFPRGTGFMWRMTLLGWREWNPAQTSGKSNRHVLASQCSHFCGNQFFL